MAKKRSSKRKDSGVKTPSRQWAVVLIFIITGLITTGITLARWSASQPPAISSPENTSIQVTPSSLSPASPSKEYIYAGGRLIATEEPAGSTPVCSFSISPSSQSFAATGGTGSIGVTAGSGCNWTATSNVAFITITSGASGSGNGTVNYSVSSNPTTSSRTGTMTIAGQTFTVTQAGSSGGGGGTPCQFVTMTPGNRTVNSSAASYNFTISSELPSGCNWTLTSDASWLAITSATSGSGPATVTYSVTQNTSGVTRQGRLSLNGTTIRHTVKQNP